MSVAENIKQRREALDMSQEELGNACGITQAMVSQLERGTKNPSLQVGALIASALKCDIHDLLR